MWAIIESECGEALPRVTRDDFGDTNSLLTLRIVVGGKRKQGGGILERCGGRLGVFGAWGT